MQVAIIASSRRPRLQTLTRIRSVTDATSLADFENVSAKWDDSDAELADCILRIAAGPLKRELVLYHEKQIRMGRPLGGQAALWHVFQRFRMEKGATMCVDITTLTNLEFKGDLEGFLAAWDHTLMALSKAPDEDLVAALFQQQVRKCKALAPAFVLYDASPEGHKNRSTSSSISPLRLRCSNGSASRRDGI